MRDFTPVTQLASSPSIVVVHPALPVKSVGDLVKLANAKPGAINYASAGSGSATFLSTELFKGRANVDLVHVPYRGGGEAITSVIAGETSVYFAPLATALEHARSGRLRALAVTTAQRLPLLPALPTLAESGYAGAESGSWYGIVLPVKTPTAAVATSGRGRRCPRGRSGRSERRREARSGDEERELEADEAALLLLLLLQLLLLLPRSAAGTEETEAAPAHTLRPFS